MNRKNPETIVERLLSNKVRASLYEEQHKIVIEHYKYGLIDYFYKGDKINIRNNNTWIDLGMLWIRENLIINEIELYTRKEVIELMINFMTPRLTKKTDEVINSLKGSIEIYLNSQEK